MEIQNAVLLVVAASRIADGLRKETHRNSLPQDSRLPSVYRCYSAHKIMEWQIVAD